jgi:hypothetical protein
MIFPHADVAELADAQVSEACDGDIVEVQVLSSAPTSDESELRFRRLAFFLSNFGTIANLRRIRRVYKYLTSAHRAGCCLKEKPGPQ